ncbi:MAG: H-NS histone family protein [Pseudoxanthomonas sp.]
MSIDLKSLSSKQLETLIDKAKKQQAKLAKRRPVAAVRKQIVDFLKREGYELAELFSAATGAKRGRKPSAAKKAAGAKKSTGKRGKVAPKYRNPANPKETWTGRGLKPRWLSALVAKGKKVEDFLIKKK